MRFSRGDKNDFKTFLTKFQILDEITWDEWAIRIMVDQVCKDLREDNIDFSEISLSLNKFTKHHNWSVHKAAEIITRNLEESSKRHNVNVGLLLSLKYESSRDDQKRFADIIFDDEIARHFVGMDLVGDEAAFDIDFYKPLIENWRKAGKHVRAHVGELPDTCKHVEDVVKCSGVDRIAHGIQASKEILDMCNNQGITFDLALHSNLYTGVVKSIGDHPIKRMIEAGCRITLNTDDPIQFGCRLDDEFDLALSNGLATKNDLEQFKDNACELFEEYIRGR